MRRTIFLVLGLSSIAFIAYLTVAMQNEEVASPLGTAFLFNQGLEVEVQYSRPYKKSRVIFGSDTLQPLVPYGQYWRLGANNATEITFNQNVLFGGKPIYRGSYRMYAIPEKHHWTLYLNSELGKFGFFEPNHALDVLEIKIRASNHDIFTEQFTISLVPEDSSIVLHFDWDSVHAQLPIEVENRSRKY